MSKPAAKKTTADRPPAAESKDGGPDTLPDQQAIAAALAPVSRFAEASSFARIRSFLRRLASRPPQVLLLEGGTAESRLAAAHYWAALLNCEQDASSPCLSCPACLRMLLHLHRDCFFLDGLAASIKIDDVRAVRAVLGESPREARFRVVIFREAQALVEAAANALLKSFEEPRSSTSFLLLAPQRERLLPTLVSRSFTLTLPWPHADAAGDGAADELAAWEAALCRFLQTGQGLFERTGTKGEVDAPLVHAITNLCRRAVAESMRPPRDAVPGEGLAALFSRLPVQHVRFLDEALAESQDSLNYGVGPTLVLEWLATRLYFLLPRS